MKLYYRLYRSYLKQSLVLSLPIMLGQLGTVAMGVADTIMVGRVGKDSLAAAGVSNSIYFLFALLGIGTLTAVAPLVSIANSLQVKQHKCYRYFRHAVYVALILSLFIMAMVQVCCYYFEWFEQAPEVTVLVKPYLTVINISTIPLLLFLAARQFSDGLGYTIPATVITFAGLGLNILLNWFFINGIWIFPEWGLYGTGVATLVSRVLMVIAMFWFVLRSPIFKTYREKAFSFAGFEPLYLRQILAKGLPSGFQYFFEIGAFSTAAIMIGQISKAASAAHQVAINPASVTYMVATGLSAGGGILVGDAFGRRSRSDVLKAGISTFILVTVFMSICAVFFLLFKEQVISWYVKEADTDVISMAMGLLVIAAFFQLSDGIQCVGLGLLRGLRDVNIPTLIALVSYWVIGIPVGRLLAFTYGMGVNGIWIGLSAGLTASALLLSSRFFYKAKRMHAALR